MADLKDIKAGDFVAVTTSSSRTPTKREVTRTTAAQVIVGTCKFMRVTGNIVGGYERAWAEPWTAKHDQRIADAARLAEQKAAFAAMFDAFDRAVSDARQLRYRDRLVDPASIRDMRTALDEAQGLIVEALGRVEP